MEVKGNRQSRLRGQSRQRGAETSTGEFLLSHTNSVQPSMGNVSREKRDLGGLQGILSFLVKGKK